MSLCELVVRDDQLPERDLLYLEIWQWDNKIFRVKCFPPLIVFED